VGFALVSRGGALKKIEAIDLTQFGIQTVGNYCDPLTGDCYSDEPKEFVMETKIDPVCKMDVNTANAQYVSEYAGQKYYFCSAEHKKEFDAHPEKYAMTAKKA
jgi:YHS domain-containing protein